MNDEELTVRQAEAYSGISGDMIRRYIREKRLPARIEGKQQYRIRKSDLDAFQNGTLTEEAFSRDKQPVDSTLLEKTVPVTIRELIEWGKLPGSGVPQVRPFHLAVKTLSR